MDKKSLIEKCRPNLVTYEGIYKGIHRNPELYCQEVRTASLVVNHLDKLTVFVVHRDIGGHGVVGVLHTNAGPTILLRANMNALPHRETTGLPYASTKIAKDAEGKETPVNGIPQTDFPHALCIPSSSRAVNFLGG